MISDKFSQIPIQKNTPFPILVTCVVIYEWSNTTTYILLNYVYSEKSGQVSKYASWVGRLLEYVYKLANFFELKM